MEVDDVGELVLINGSGAINLLSSGYTKNDCGVIFPWIIFLDKRKGGRNWQVTL